MILSAMRFIGRALPVAFSLLAVQPAAARTVAVTQANLVQSFNNAQPGDHLVLAPGGYGLVVLPRKVWAQAITVDARSAAMTGIVMRYTSGVEWSGGTIVGTSYGVSIRDSQRITIANMNISGAQRGIVINGSTDIKIQKNKLYGLQTDGVDVVGANVLVENNTITDMHPVAEDHPDGIQVWSTAEFRSRDIIIRNNTIIGNMQGVFARAAGIGMDRLTVVGNKVTTMWGNGIALLDAYDSVAKGNTVHAATGSRYKANMRVEGARNVTCANIVPDVPRAAAALPCGTA